MTNQIDLKSKYSENYYQIACLKKYIESGIILSSVNYWRDSFQGLKEIEVIENKEMFMIKNEAYFQNIFILQFFTEVFPEVEENIEMTQVFSILQIIKQVEGENTYNQFVDCILDYATEIAKASKEDWLAFIGIKDNISDKEAVFIKNLRILITNI